MGDFGTQAGGADSAGAAAQDPPSTKQGFFARKRTIVLTAGIAVVAVAGIAIGLATTSSSSNSATTTASSAGTNPAAHGFPGASGQGANARTTNEPGGTSGVVSSVSSSGFTIKTTVGGTVTIDESSSTTYQNATGATATATTASAITTGAAVLVLGTVNSTTVSATQITLEPAGSAYTTASADVSAEQKGQQNTSQSYGTIPSDYTEGQGTIVDTATSDQAVIAALAKYPGGIVDRVVQLANGDYEVHDIGTNMHHIFEDSSFQVIGAN
jgi:hypothetical protein